MAVNLRGKEHQITKTRNRVFEESTALYVRTTEIQYTWTIHNFSLCPMKVNHSMKSPLFLGDVKDNYNWQLIAYPNGESDECEGYLSLQLCFVPGKKSEVTAKCDLTILNDKKTKYFTQPLTTECRTFRNESPLSYWKFIPRNSLFDGTLGLLPNDALTIVCDIVIIDDFGSTMKKPYPEVCKITACQRFRQDISDLYDSPKLCDVTLITCGREIQAHKVILAARSPVFAAMFNNDMKEKQENQVDITDVDCDVVKEMLRYIYTGKAMNLDKVADGLLAAADKYELETLKDHCEEALCKSITDENAASLLALGDFHSAVHLKAEALDFICTHTKEVLKTARYQSLHDTHRHLIDEIFEALANKIMVSKTSAVSAPD